VAHLAQYALILSSDEQEMSRCEENEDLEKLNALVAHAEAESAVIQPLENFAEIIGGR
jgi:hypothetical protein